MKTLTGILMALLAVGTAQAEESELLVSAQKQGGGVELVFDLLNEGNVAGVSFDVVFSGKLEKGQVDLSNCVGTRRGSPLAGCNLLNKNTIRVGIIHPELGEMETGELGRISVKGVSGMDFHVEKVRLVDAQGNEREINALTDSKPALFEKQRDSR